MSSPWADAVALHTSLSLMQYWEKYPLKALKKRCRWMLLSTSFQKVLMKIYICLCLHIQTTPHLLGSGSVRWELHVLSCRSAGVTGPLAWGHWAVSVTEMLNKPMHLIFPKWERLVSFKLEPTDFHETRVHITLKAMPVSCNKGVFLAC